MAKALVVLNACLALVIVGYLVWSAPSLRQQARDEKLAVEQAKKGARFTAADGRQLCLALVTAHPEVLPSLPPVCVPLAP